MSTNSTKAGENFSGAGPRESKDAAAISKRLDAHLLATGWRDGTMDKLKPKAFELIGVEGSPTTKPVPNEEIIRPETRKAIWEAQFASAGMTEAEMVAQVRRDNANRRKTSAPEPSES